MSMIPGVTICRAVALGKTLSHECNVNKSTNCWLKNTSGGIGEMSSNID